MSEGAPLIRSPVVGTGAERAWLAGGARARRCSEPSAERARPNGPRERERRRRERQQRQRYPGVYEPQPSRGALARFHPSRRSSVHTSVYLFSFLAARPGSPSPQVHPTVESLCRRRAHARMRSRAGEPHGPERRSIRAGSGDQRRGRQRRCERPARFAPLPNEAELHRKK